MPDASELDVTETERQALHDFQVGLEYVYRGYGSLLDFHHHLGHAMDRFRTAEDRLRAAGHEDLADELRDEHLPAGIVDDKWSYEVVAAFRRDLLQRITEYEANVREELADGEHHVTERIQQREWRDRADGDAWRKASPDSVHDHSAPSDEAEESSDEPSEN